MQSKTHSLDGLGRFAAPVISFHHRLDDSRPRGIGRSTASVFRWMVLFALLGCFLLSPAIAIESARLSSDQLAQVGELLRQGRQFEIGDRWDEALTHYEKAIREFPGEQSLKHRFDLSRMHYDLQRRLRDASFCDSLNRLTFTQALNLYEEVLVRIQTHYVETPDWQDLVEQGRNDFEVALSEPAYGNRFLSGVSRQQIDAFLQTMRAELDQRVIRNRTDARAAVAWAADLAQQQLGLPAAAVVLEFNCGATNCLDAYSAFLTPDQLDEVYSQIEGNFVGLGIELKTIEGRLNIVRVIPNSPAETAGIRQNDNILAIDGHDISNMSTDQAAGLLQGEAGTMVELLVAASGENSRRVRAERRRVDVPSIDEIKIIDPQQGIGYLRLTCFQKSTSRDLDDALWRLHRQGMRGGLIIDLRSNPGGLLVAAVEAVDKFVERGVIVSTRGRDVREGFTYSAHEAGTWRVPLCVLIDGDSASAAEIFAGAIRDHHRGTIIGQRSYGKGSVQGIFPLHSHSSGMRLTTAKFYSPDGHPFSLVGVSPDKGYEVPIVRTVAKPPINGQINSRQQDVALNEALRYARHALSQSAAPGYSRVQR